MLFQTIEFAVFFVLLLAVLLLVNRNQPKKAILLLFSYAFYMFWNPAFIVLLLVITLINYAAGHQIAVSPAGRRKLWLTASIVLNLSVLAYFKYFHFLEDNLLLLLRMFGQTPSWTAQNIFLPIGISFYTFEVISYNIDIYRGETKPASSLLDFALFLAFFPRLVAGPILRPTDFMSQLNGYRGLRPEPVYVVQFVKGLFKKLIIADNLCYFADTILNNPETYPSAIIWVAVLCFTVQIYCDFSGYSDMAIAIAGFLGYDFPANFNRPYFAISPAEFWQKWHISLSSWLRDYLYIPLGGNRLGPFMTYRNLMLTMLIGGLWHGASWNFVIWGGLHGLVQIVYRYFGIDQWLKHHQSLLVKVISWFLFQYFVWITWITFRVTDFKRMMVVLKKFILFDFDFNIQNAGLGKLSFFSTLLYLMAFVVLHMWSNKVAGAEHYLTRERPVALSVAMFLTGLLLILCWPLREAPFIYFQF